MQTAIERPFVASVRLPMIAALQAPADVFFLEREDQIRVQREEGQAAWRLQLEQQGQWVTVYQGPHEPKLTITREG